MVFLLLLVVLLLVVLLLVVLLLVVLLLVVLLLVVPLLLLCNITLLLTVTFNGFPSLFSLVSQCI